MKRLKLLSAAIALFSTTLLAQAPQGFKYQAVARNTQGQILANQNIGVQVAIIDSAAGGTMAYQETFATTTNANGLFSIDIGTGNATNGTFSTINWATANKWVKLDLDATGGTNYTNMGMFELLSVPYALYANAAGGSVSNQNCATTDAVPHVDNNGSLACGLILDNNSAVSIGGPIETTYTTSNGNISVKFSIYGNTITHGGLYSTSDERLKTNIKPIENALDKVRKIGGYSFKFKPELMPADSRSTNTNLGFLAQQLKQVLPDLVAQDQNGYYVVNYDGVIPVLTEAIKEQDKTIQSQQSQIDELNKRLTEMESLLKNK